VPFPILQDNLLLQFRLATVLSAADSQSQIQPQFRPKFFLQKPFRRNNMKSFRQIFAATVLMLALTISSYPGEISVPGARSTGEISVPGTRITTEIVISELSPEVAALDSMTEGMLGVLQSLLLIF
jgi:hypothetical protein